MDDYRCNDVFFGVDSKVCRRPHSSQSVGASPASKRKSGSRFFGRSLSAKRLEALIGHAPTFGSGAASQSIEYDASSEASTPSSIRGTVSSTAQVKWVKCFIVLKGTLVYFYRTAHDMMHYYALDLSMVEVEAEYSRNIFLTSTDEGIRIRSGERTATIETGGCAR